MDFQGRRGWSRCDGRWHRPGGNLPACRWSKDIDQKQLTRPRMEKICQDRIDKGKTTPGQVQEKLGLIEYSLTYDGFSDVDIVIEAVPG